MKQPYIQKQDFVNLLKDIKDNTIVEDIGLYTQICYSKEYKITLIFQQEENEEEQILIQAYNSNRVLAILTFKKVSDKFYISHYHLNQEEIDLFGWKIFKKYEDNYEINSSRSSN